MNDDLLAAPVLQRLAVLGARVADAAALGLHWLYSPERIARIETTGSILFRQPDRAHYEGQPGYFVHAGRSAGMPSQYGEHLNLVARTIACDGRYSVEAHRAAFLGCFGPGGRWVGYADRPTRALVARLLDRAGDAPVRTGIDDDQMPVLAVVAPLHASGAARHQVASAVEVMSSSEDALAGSLALFDALEAFADGAVADREPRRVVLMAVARSLDGPLGALLVEALDATSLSPAELAERFGAACHMRQGLPIAFHLALHASDFEGAVSDNVRIGGDSCGRAMAIGALAGLAFGVPGSLASRLTVA